AEDEREDDDRDREPDQLADGRGELLGLVDDRAASRHLEARRLTDLRHAGEPLAGRALKILRGLVVLHGDEADPLVAAELERRDAGDVRLALDGLGGLLDRRVVLQARLPRE